MWWARRLRRAAAILRFVGPRRHDPQSSGVEQRCLVTRLKAGLAASPVRTAAAAGVGFFLLVVAVNDLGRLLEWDEGVYLSVVSPDIPDVCYASQRARGIILAAFPFYFVEVDPFGSFDLFVELRLWMSALHAAALALFVLVWHRVIGAAALTAAAIFGVSWLAVFYAPELSPNLLAGLLLGSAVGALIVEAPPEKQMKWDLAAASMIAYAAFVRPTDAVWYTAGAFLALAALRAPLRRLLAVIGGGLLVGVIPWVVKAEMSFGGTIQRLKTAAEITETGKGLTLWDHLKLLDGPLLGPDPTGHIPAVGLAWLVVCLILAGGGTLKRPFGAKAAAIPLAAAATHAFPYMALTGALAPRFLIPANLLIAVLAAQGIRAGFGQGAASRPVTRALAFGLIAMSLWQVAQANSQSSNELERRSTASEVAEYMAAEAGGGPCAFGSQSWVPQLQVYSLCVGAKMLPEDDQLHPATEKALQDGEPVYVVFWRTPAERSPVREWDSTKLPTSSGAMVTVYRSPESLTSKISSRDRAATHACG